MDHLDLACAVLAAIAMASLVYAGTVVPSPKDFTSMDIDMVVVTAVATFVSMMVAQHPEWLS